MAGSSNNASVESSCGSASTRRGGSVKGIPKRCWCGTEIVPLMSNSENNPYRRYFRCGHAAAKKLKNDNHVFKWIDEVLLDEMESIHLKIGKHQDQLNEMAKKQSCLAETIQIKVEEVIIDHVEQALEQGKASMKKMMVLSVLGCIILGVLMGKLL